ncbi:unnamed protein product [Protopolystoma xenopodis]|uniref:Uncharacterized protein n=1 Tax=Protopolystoma xenopodis TaxID=117903 RepID=A0A448WYU3_9PLAT|nr:unnamed protein product [Protopolystoma xenopodis]
MRESHFAQLQRQLREHGVSLRHHHPDVYTRVLEHVKTGCQLQPISFVFHDFKLKRSMLCRLQSISEVYITPYSGQEINRGSSNDVPQNLEQHRPAHFPEPSDSRQEKEIPSKEAWRRNKTNKASVTLRAQYQTFTQDQTSTTVQPNASEMARLSVNQSTLRMARTTETEL